MRTGWLVRIILGALLSFSTHAVAQSPRDTPATPAPGARAPALLSQGDCFLAFGSYDHWMDGLWKRNNVLAYFLIRWKFPRDDYERYRRELDCRYITYRSDRYVVQGWLVQPRQRRGAKLPVIIYDRGGNRGFGALTFANLFTHVFPLAERGYLVAASQYRGVDSPRDARSSPDQFGGEDVHDVTNLIRVVAGLAQADPSRLYMIGQSRGSIMAFRALLETPVPIRAVAIYSGIYDMDDLLRFRPEFDGLFNELIPGYASHRQRELDRRSVTHWAEKLPAATGLLLFQGGDDDRVPAGSAAKFAAQLKRLGRPYRLIQYPDDSHFLDQNRDQVHAETIRWFQRFQGPRAPTPALPAH
jgi:dipeptidyl aminopeptidase/acylaminoacyl peptidase